jgi:enoyl-CoA hydratase/carnithine racemase
MKQGVLKNYVVRVPFPTILDVDREDIDKAFVEFDLMDTQFLPAGVRMPDAAKATTKVLASANPKPLIAAVNGYALGAGNELAMCCDFVIAGRNAQFGQPEVKTGGMPGDGGTQRLPRKVGPNLAAYMIMTGNTIDADTAHRVGYAVEVCEVRDTVRRACEIAEVIASRAPFAVRSSKACIAVAVGATLENGLAFERYSIIRNHASADRAEGLAAFLEKRLPKFVGEN